MTVSDLTCVRGDSVTIEIGPVTLADQTGAETAVDLTTLGAAYLTVKVNADDDDTDALWQGAIGSGITANDPATTAKNYMTARIPAGTFASDAPEFAADRVTLVWDCEIETGSRHETIARGTLAVIADVGHHA